MSRCIFRKDYLLYNATKVTIGVNIPAGGNEESKIVPCLCGITKQPFLPPVDPVSSLLHYVTLRLVNVEQLGKSSLGTRIVTTAKKQFRAPTNETAVLVGPANYPGILVASQHFLILP